MYSKDRIKIRLEEQRLLGRPRFKNAIIDVLVDDYAFSRDVAESVVRSKAVDDRIMEDIAWSQHMGVGYWATEVLFDVCHRKEQLKLENQN